MLNPAAGAEGSRFYRFTTFFSNNIIGLYIILYIGFMHGLVYVFIVPPWQHYDEPSHFEYAWLLAKHAWPVTSEHIDPLLRADVLASMEAHHFFTGMTNTPTWIVVSQFVDPPLYHFLAGVPVRLFPSFNITDQMYMMRIVSLGFLLLSIAAAWGAARELAPPGHPLRWMTPLFLALLPGFVDLMTAVNNDTAAVALCSLFFWASVRLICRGFSWSRVLLLLLITFLAFFTKKTIWTVSLFVPLVLMLVTIPPRLRWLVWVGSAAIGVLGLVTFFEWGDARDWYRQTEQSSLTRTQSKAILDLPYAFQVQGGPGDLPALWQNLPLSSTASIRGKTITIGGWVWASRLVTAYSPGLVYHGSSIANTDIQAVPLEVDVLPRFISTVVEVPAQANRALIVLKPLRVPETEAITVYYSGLFLVEGTCEIGAIPMFDGPAGSEGTWCGQPFRNLVRNANAASSWPAPRSVIFQWVGSYLPVNRSNLSEMVAFVFDREGFQWYDAITRTQLFDTFWGKFGWGHVPLMSASIYLLLAVLTVLSMFGAVISIVFHRKLLRLITLSFILFIVFFGLTGWLTAFVAGIYFGGMTERVVIPVARYAYPVIIPTALLMTVGWWEWFKQIGKRIPSFQELGVYLYLILFILLDIYALASIAYFYYWMKPL
jgi:hypothetical protein